MEHDELIEEVVAALGTSDLSPLRQGGQKLVLSGELEGAPVVVKIVPIPAGTAYADEVLERAQREVELLSTIDSEFVVDVLSEAVEIGEPPEAICWVEERLDGEDLANLRSGFPWTAMHVWDLIRDIGQGLDACHQLDVVHRDLSAGNVRRCDDGRFVLMDPGLARHLTKAALTGQFQPGTPGYMTPEHVPGGSPTPASDIFALGILAHLALTGTLPVNPTSPLDPYYETLRRDDVPPVRTVTPDVPSDLAAVIDRCLQRQPARRFIDAAELLDALPPAIRRSTP